MEGEIGEGEKERKAGGGVAKGAESERVLRTKN